MAPAFREERDGERIVVTTHRPRARALGPLALALPFLASAGFLKWIYGAAAPFATGWLVGIAVLVSLFLLWSGAQHLLNDYRIEIDREWLRVRETPLPWTRFDIRLLLVERVVAPAARDGYTWLVLVLDDGRELPLPVETAAGDAEAIAHKLSSAIAEARAPRSYRD